MWMIEVLIYGLLKGTREIVKKKSLQKSSVMEVLVFYTLFAFLFVCPDAKNAMGVDAKHMLYIMLKSFIIFLAWMCSFKAIKKMPISMYGILDLSRILFATLLAVIVMQESLSANQMGGLILVGSGLLMLKGVNFRWKDFLRKGKETKNQGNTDRTDNGKEYSAKTDENQEIDFSVNQKDSHESIRTSTKKNVRYKETAEKSNNHDNTIEKVPAILVLFAIASCMLNALSGLMDKILMKDLSSSQLQFWYMLFLVMFYILYIILSKTKIDIRNSLKNPWIWLLALLFVVADRSLFLANANPASKISIMTLIKQSGCIVTILAGKFIFHEKNIAYKLVCAAVIISGIVIAVL